MYKHRLILLALFCCAASDVHTQEVFNLTSAVKLQLIDIPLFDEYGRKLIDVNNMEYVEDLCGDTAKDLAIVSTHAGVYRHWIQNGTATLDTSGDYYWFDVSWIVPFNYDANATKEYLTDYVGIVECRSSDTSVISRIETPNCFEFARQPRSIDINGDGFVDVAGIPGESTKLQFLLIMGGNSDAVCDSIKVIGDIDNQIAIDVPFRCDNVYAASMPLGQDSAKKIYLYQLNLDAGSGGHGSATTVVDSIVPPIEGATIYQIRQFVSNSAGRAYFAILWRNAGEFGLLKLYEVTNNQFIELNTVSAENISRFAIVEGNKDDLVPIVGIEFRNRVNVTTEVHLFRIDNITRSFVYTDDYTTLPPNFQLVSDQNHDDFPEFLISNYASVEHALAIAVFKDAYFSAQPVGVDENKSILSEELQLIGSRLYLPSTMSGEVAVSVYSTLGERVSELRVQSSSGFVELDQCVLLKGQPIIVVARCGRNIASTLMFQ